MKPDNTPGEAAASSMVQSLRDGDIEHVFIEFSDVNGISRSKQLRTDYFLQGWRDGFAMNALLLVQTPQSDVPEDSGLGESIDYGDATVYPEPETFQRLPWQEDTARVLCSFELNGEQLGVDPRQALQRVLNEKVTDHELDFTVGSELEFYLLDQTDGGEYQPATDDEYE